MNVEKFIKERIQNEWNGKVYLGFYEDEEIDMFEMMELYAESKAENLPISGVSLSLPSHIDAGKEAKKYANEMNGKRKPNGFHELDFYNGTKTKKVTITLCPEQQEKAREMSKKLFGRENISGFVAYLIEHYGTT